ncbi:MAG: 16S rRNA (cytosine(1402)-N(4))-methyltransferase RsmH [Desulfobacteraceae bacterium]|nr:16S rRNA (cytosine(1402)-N(4))-methyltransferase RsmH [Desulfobacteraceae bacterium]
MQPDHVPVLLAEVIEWLQPRPRGIYIDGNLGLGGHAGAILEASQPDGILVGFEWDAEALREAKKRLAHFGERVHFVHRNFASLKESLAGLGIQEVDGLLLDLGLSSLQLDAGGRGFSFKGSQPLDMRMDAREPETAADLLNTAAEEELADIFYYYGEERQARRIAAAVVETRQREPLATTDQLVGIIERAVPRRYHPAKIHVGTKVFQALRIAVNHELENLSRVLEDGAGLLRAGGRFCAISFHSLEDRLVKRAFAENEILQVLTRKPITPGAEECRRNSRARSAKMRVAARREGRA